MPTTLQLLVLRTTDLEAALRFYGALGLRFVQERHGDGPVHFASRVGELVLELYPGAAGRAPARRTGGATMLGLGVDDLESALARLEAIGARVLTARRATATGFRAVVEDPDGRAIELSSTSPPSG